MKGFHTREELETGPKIQLQSRNPKLDEYCQTHTNKHTYCLSLSPTHLLQLLEVSETKGSGEWEGGNSFCLPFSFLFPHCISHYIYSNIRQILSLPTHGSFLHPHMR